jgi:hypothetical protein
MGGHLADVDVPAKFAPDVELNAIVRSRRAEFRKPDVIPVSRPEMEAVEENKRKWGSDA